MKTIEMFLASSIEELAGERKEIESFINALNNIFAPKGVYFKLNMCEHTSEALNLDGMQNKYNAIIRQCEKFYLLIGKEVGQFTKEEFDVALDQLRKTDNKTPKIYTYFRENGDSLSDSVNELQKKIAELRHYWTMFDHIDTVKYKIMLELARDPEIAEELSLKNGVLYSGNIAIESINMDNVPSYANSRTVRELRKKCKALDDKLAVLRARIKEDDSCLDEYGRLCVKRSDMEKEREAAETQFLKAAKNIVEISTSGELLTKRAKEAIELMDKGEYEQAQTLLDDDTRARELGNAANRAEAEIDSIRALVKESLLKIDSLKSTGVDQNSIPQILTVYEQVEDYSERFSLDYIPVCDYIDFLAFLNDYSRAQEKADRLYHLYNGRKEKDPMEYFDFLTTLVGIYFDIHNDAKTEEILKEEEMLLKKMQLGDENRLKEKKAVYYNDLGALYSDMHRYEEAEKLYAEALKILRELTEQNREAYLPDLANSCNNLGGLYYYMNRYEEAEKLYAEALKIRRELTEKNWEAYLPSLARSCNNLGMLYCDMHRYEEAEKLHAEALEIHRELAEQNREAYLPDLANSCNNLGILYSDMNRYADAEKLKAEALEIHRELTEKNREAYLPNLARSCNNLGVLYRNMHRYEEAEKLYAEALEIRRELTEQNREAYLPDLATSCNNLGDLYNERRNYSKMGQCLREAVDLYREIGDIEALINSLYGLSIAYDHNPVMKKEAQKIRREIKELEEKYKAER